MHQRYIPEWLRHPPAPGVRGFASLTGMEAVVRGVLISVFPIAVYKALQDARLVSEVYFIVGLVSLISGLLVPFISRYMPRHRIYILGVSLYIIGSLLASTGSAMAIVSALFINTIATVITFVCLNAYVLDYISKVQLSQCETSRMFYSALGWTIGPVLGVLLMKWWEPAPFLLSAFAALILLCVFVYMRLGKGRLISKSRVPPPNPLAFLPRFAVQPRLVAGWLFAVIRSAAWWVYVVYLPIFAIQNGMGEQLGGIVLTITNTTLFLTPIMLKFMQKYSIRHAVRLGFFMSGVLFSAATVVSDSPPSAIAFLICGSFFLILLDISAGLPFLLAIKPSERTEMSAVYSSFRDVSAIATPGATWLVLLFSPLSGVFIVTGVSLLAAWSLAGRLHPRLGKARIKSQVAAEIIESRPESSSI